LLSSSDSLTVLFLVLMRSTFFESSFILLRKF
jgi:hypothetical protein